MSLVIISSIKDPASINIKECLLEQSTWEIVDSFDNKPVYCNSNIKDVFIVTITDRKITRENLDLEIEKKLIIKPKHVIFISRHTSKMKTPTLTVHPVGNYGEAQLGGRSKTLVKCSPWLMTDLLRLIKKNYYSTDLDYQICFEVTHHGPYLNTPTLFAEIGSTSKEWSNKESGNIIAQSILELLQKHSDINKISKEIPVLIGIGGGHYAPRFTDIIFEKQAVFGHMIPSYHINSGNIDSEMLEKTLKATPCVKGIYLHRKALKKSQITEYKNWFQKKDIPIISSKELPSLN